jgi:ABC-2 type transport system ATP-binding protein
MEPSAGGGLGVDSLSYSYGARQALSDVTFEIEKGAFCALLGQNGAGKSTLFSILTRLLVPDGGVVRFAGVALDRAPRMALARMGIVFQQPSLDADLSVRRNLRYFASLHGLSGKDVDRRIAAVLERLGMADRAGDRARELSGGQRRRVEIARALLHGPEVLLLDEPTVGLDARSRAAITAHVHDLCVEDRLTVLWATHLVDEIRPSDDVIVLHRGRVLAHRGAGALAAGRPLAEAFLAMTAVPE